MARTIAVVNQKGGVGKTTVTLNVAAALVVHLGYRVAIIDLDPQRHATYGLLKDPDQEMLTIHDVLMDPEGEITLDQALRSVGHEDLFVVPGSTKMWDVEEIVLRRNLDVLKFLGDFRRVLTERIPKTVDVVLIDTYPSRGLLLKGALAASDGALIVSEPEVYATDGLGQLVSTIKELKQSGVNPGLHITGVILNKVRGRTIEHASFVESYRKTYGDAVLEPVIPQATVIPEAQGRHTPLELYEDKGAHKLEAMKEIYRSLARQVADKEKLPKRKGRGEVDLDGGAQ